MRPWSKRKRDKSVKEKIEILKRFHNGEDVSHEILDDVIEKITGFVLVDPITGERYSLVEVLQKIEQEIAPPSVASTEIVSTQTTKPIEEVKPSIQSTHISKKTEPLEPQENDVQSGVEVNGERSIMVHGKRIPLDEFFWQETPFSHWINRRIN